MSNEQFKRDIAGFIARSKRSVEATVREIALQMLSSIVNKSPVDTGRFRGNWYVQPDTTPQSTESILNEAVERAAVELGRFKVGDTIYILNHLPYSVRLEHGYSKQAPAGMVKITVAEFEQFVRASAVKAATSQ